MADKIPTGISYPIQRGQTGYFESTYDTSESVKNALTNLVLTPKNTRPGRPEYGSSLYSLLFDPVNDVDGDIISNILQEDINMWVPSVEIISIKMDNSTTNYEALSLKINYRIKNTPLIDELSLTISI